MRGDFRGTGLFPLARLPLVILSVFALTLPARFGCSALEAGEPLPHPTGGGAQDASGTPSEIARGQALLANGRLAEAEQAFRNATESDPTSPPAWNSLGLVLYQEKRPDAALEAFRKALSFEPLEARLYTNIGTCLYELQRYDEAAQALERAAQMDPTNGKPHLVLGRIATERGDSDQAESELRKAASLSRGDPMAHYFLGLLLFERRRLPESIREFEESLKLSPEMPSAHLNLGLALMRTGDPTQARLHLDRFKSLTAANLAGERRRMAVTNRLQAANAEMNSGRLDAALALVLEARERAPNEPAVHAFLAEIYARQGRTDDGSRERAEFDRLSKGQDAGR